MSIPRHFLPESGRTLTPRKEAFPLAHVIDALVIGSRVRVSREWIVGLDGIGQLAMRAAHDASALMSTARAEYAYNDVARGAPPRQLDAHEVFMMSVQLLEQPGDAPGLDDPVYLYGTLYGPYPSEAGGRSSAVNGQLMTTRGEILQAFLDAQDFAFSYESDGDSLAQPKFFHLMLPADRVDAISRGLGIVLAYPMLPDALALDDVGNELVVDRLLHDLLNALQNDARRASLDNAFTRATIPVTNRARVVQRLKNEGYRIEGDTAIKQTKSSSGFGAMLSSVFGSWAADEVRIPHEGTTADFMKLARLALAQLSDWPPKRMQTLSECLQRISEADRPAAPTFAKGPSAAPPPPSPTPARQPKKPERHQGPPQWMKDFVASHQGKRAKKSNLTYSHEVVSDDPSWRDDLSDPEWMSDFEGRHKRQAGSADTPTAGEREDTESNPDWMSDFE